MREERLDGTAAADDASALIAADVGGTHARLAWIEPADDASAFAIRAYREYVCAEFPSLAAIVVAFRAETGAPAQRVALAIAGYVVDGAVVNVSLPWSVSIAALRDAIGARELAVVNDFEAAAHAIGRVGAADATRLCGPERSRGGAELVVGPGTGLGAALRVPQDGRTLVLATEAGQATLAPETDLEFELLRELRRSEPRVLIEHVLSGGGLARLDAAIRVVRGAPAAARTPAEISAAALDGGDAIAAEAVETFCGWLGAVLGDLVLLYGAQGGVHLAGGVLPRIRPLLARSRFVERFLAKGAMRAALERTPVRLVDHAQLGVVGAASWYFDRGRAAGARSLSFDAAQA
ncbi:MAG TPA: glucokinase [Dokdonella sp.]